MTVTMSILTVCEVKYVDLAEVRRPTPMYACFDKNTADAAHHLILAGGAQDADTNTLPGGLEDRKRT